MSSEPTTPSFFGRFVIVAAAIVLLGMGWASVRHHPEAVVSYATTPPVEVSVVSFGDDGAVEPRVCQPEKGVDSACTYEAGR